LAAAFSSFFRTVTDSVVLGILFDEIKRGIERAARHCKPWQLGAIFFLRRPDRVVRVAHLAAVQLNLGTIYAIGPWKAQRKRASRA
jgi:hypothetical protein